MRVRSLCGFFAIGVLAALLASAAMAAKTNYVSKAGTQTVSPYTSWALATTNIQAAISDTVAGDTVLVSNGTYYINDQISLTNAITVRSLGGASQTIVARAASGTNAPQHRIFSNSAAATLDGFTVKNGYLYGANSGGGIYMSAGTVQNCVIFTNVLDSVWGTAMYGVGVYMSGGTLQFCTIVSNASGYYSLGGGVCQAGGLLLSNTISYNSVSAGGGLSTVAGTVQYCTFEYNFGSLGGGIGSHGNYPATVISNCVIRFNSAAQGGGFGMPGITLFVDSMIVSNTATSQGGGIYSSQNYNNLYFKCCIISGNSCAAGAGIYLVLGNASGYGSYNFDNCLIRDNVGTYSIYMTGGPNWAKFRNCTIAANQPCGINIEGPFSTNIYSEAKIVYPLFQNTIIYNFATNIYSATPSVLADIFTNSFTNCCSPQLTAPGFNNIAADPMFIGGGNWRLNANSPCINTGTNQTWMTNWERSGTS